MNCYSEDRLVGFSGTEARWITLWLIVWSSLFATSETRRKLGRVYFPAQRLLGLSLEREKMANSWPARSHGNDPRKNCGTHFRSSSLFVSNVANEDQRRNSQECLIIDVKGINENRLLKPQNIIQKYSEKCYWFLHLCPRHLSCKWRHLYVSVRMMAC